jgi:hypothetical protein
MGWQGLGHRFRKKIALIILGVISSTITAFSVVLPFIIWALIIYVLWNFFVGFYKGLFGWLQEKLCQLRDWFDVRYDRFSPPGQPVMLSLLLPFMAVELVLVSGFTVYTVWLQLSFLSGPGDMQPVQTVFASIICGIVGLQMYISYRSDTEIVRRLRGDGLDYGILTALAPFDDFTS